MLIYQRILGCLLLVTLLSACASNREFVQMPPSFLTSPKKVVIVRLSGLEKPGYYKIGQQGILDVLINEAMTSSVLEKVEKIDATSIVEEEYYKRFNQAFASRAFEIKEDHIPLNKQNLLPPPVKEPKYAPYDFRFLQEKYNVDYAVVLDPISFGVKRFYHAFLPTDNPEGFAKISFYVVNLSNNAVVAECHPMEHNTVKGEWDTPPEYSNLIKSVKEALARAISGAHNFFFQ